jgi:hypothetical protein
MRPDPSSPARGVKRLAPHDGEDLRVAELRGVEIRRLEDPCQTQPEIRAEQILQSDGRIDHEPHRERT